MRDDTLDAVIFILDDYEESINERIDFYLHNAGNTIVEHLEIVNFYDDK